MNKTLSSKTETESSFHTCLSLVKRGSQVSVDVENLCSLHFTPSLQAQVGRNTLYTNSPQSSLSSRLRMPPSAHSHTPHLLLTTPKTSTEPVSQTPSRILVILNAPITSLDLVRRLWKSCAVRICADGGANRLHDFLKGESVRKDGVVVEGVGLHEEMVSCAFLLIE
jgi:hypothetical protein